MSDLIPSLAGASYGEISRLKEFKNHPLSELDGTISAEKPEKTSCCAAQLPSRSLSPLVGLGIFVALIAGYIISDIWLGSFLAKLLQGLPPRFQDGLSFFIAHSVALVSLLAGVTYLAVFARTFVNTEKVRSKLNRVNSTSAHGVAAAVGVITPFCSCSAVPVFTGFVRSGVPISQSISFLVASPLVNEISVILLATFVGWSMAGLYAATGFLIAIVSGLLLRRFVTPEWTEVEPKQLLKTVGKNHSSRKPSLGERAYSALDEARATVKSTFVYVLIGVGFGAIIHDWMPVSAIKEIVSWGPFAGVLAATLTGVPLYSGMATVIPIITVLHEKGMPMGTLMAFSMSVTALSFPEALLLRRVMKPKLLATFFGTVAAGIIIVGLVFNLIL